MQLMHTSVEHAHCIPDRRKKERNKNIFKVVERKKKEKR